MKKLLALLAIVIYTTGIAQTAKGKYVIGVNTPVTVTSTSTTGISYTKIEGKNYLNLGLDVGYFVADYLAIKGGVGFYNFNIDGEKVTNGLTYKVGAQYYLARKIPIQVDFTGTSLKDVKTNPYYIGVQGGFAFFPTRYLSIEPTVRYDISMVDTYKNVLSGRIGINIFL